MMRLGVSKNLTTFASGYLTQYAKLCDSQHVQYNLSRNLILLLQDHLLQAIYRESAAFSRKSREEEIL
jgi:hypothetical protein